MTKKKGTPLTGSCACGSRELRARVTYRGKLRVACNRCATRVRDGGDFLEPYFTVRNRKEKIQPRVLRMVEAGKSSVEIAKAEGISARTVRRWARDA